MQAQEIIQPDTDALIAAEIADGACREHLDHDCPVCHASRVWDAENERIDREKREQSEWTAEMFALCYPQFYRR